MKKIRLFGAIIVILLMFSSIAEAHGDEKVPDGDDEHRAELSAYIPFDPFLIALYVFAFVMVLAAISIFFQSRMSEKVKKIFFVVIAVSVILTTLYAGGSTVYLNVISESGGPIHWHADFELWVCGDQILNPERPQGISNKVGSSVFHHHDDFRIHIEGIVIKMQDVSLGRFFDTIGGEFDGDHLTINLDDGTSRTISNGESCPDGKKGKWKLYIKNHETGEFEENLELEKYVIKPHFEIPPGDFLKLVFDSNEGVPNGS